MGESEPDQGDGEGTPKGLTGETLDEKGQANEERRKRLLTGIVTAFQQSNAPDIPSSLDADPRGHQAVAGRA